MGRYFEPWEPRPARVSPERHPSVTPEADPDHHGSYRLWGSGMVAPTVQTHFDGSPVPLDDRRMVAAVDAVVTDRDRPPRPRDVAARIAECVNACTGLDEPEAAIRYARRVLLALADGELAAADLKVVRAAALLSPVPTPEE